MASEAEEDAWKDLPEGEARSVWDETERHFWAKLRRQHDAEKEEAEQEYQTTVTDAKVELGTLTGRRNHLNETRIRLTKEIAKVEEELAHIAMECEEKTDRLVRIEHDYRKTRQTKLEAQQNIIKTMRKFFKGKRGDEDEDEEEEAEGLSLADLAPLPASPEEQAPATGTQLLTRDVVANEITVNGMAAESPDVRRPSHVKGIETVITPGGDPIVDIVDADGRVIGPVRRIEPWNQWVEGIQDLEIRRPVKIRRGRRFNDVHLNTIYERTEGKGVKWLSCMIQATGQIQEQRCLSCDKNQGAFDDCIIVGGDFFQKCGNCEWNRQGCHGASGRTIDMAESKRRGRQQQQARNAIQTLARQEPEYASRPRYDVVGRGRTTERHPLPQVSLAPRTSLPDRPRPSSEYDAAGKASFASNGVYVGREPEQMPTPYEHRATPGFTAANTRSRPPSVDRRTPSSMPADTSPRSTESMAEEPLEEINNDNLMLRHDGTVYTYPECVEGVPLAKIDETHPYWETSWQNVRSLIEPQLAKWREKHQVAIEAGPKQEKGGSSKYQIGRQVNRGYKIMEFIEEGTISPYQLLSKKYMLSGKGGICSYDTLFRLSETVSELSKFKLDITPVEWIRQRLHELIMIQGANFNLPKIIHDFYHDIKLSALRQKHGFKNIGRPSGMKTGRHSFDSPTITPKPLKKRKSMHSMAGTPRESPSQSPPMPHIQLATAPISTTGFSTHLNKRPKLLSPAPGPIHDELHVTDTTDTDSWSGGEIGSGDYRVAQLKTRHYTSSPQVTQYWTWIENDNVFQHQVLKGTDPVEWGVLKAPIDFDLNLDEVQELVWNMTALRIRLVMHTENTVVSKQDGQPRGDMMASFKRERTLRRFLRFCRDKGLPMRKESSEDLDRSWLAMKSEQLPAENGQPSKELLE